MIEKSKNITLLAVALLKAQKEMGAALKDAKNPFFKSSYADLKAVIDAIKEPLNNNGVTFLQAVDRGEAQPSIETILLHESGQFISSRTPVFCAKPNDPQAFGSGITYSKRYALQAMLGLPTKDDDGEAAMGRKAQKQTSKPKSKQKDIVDMAFLAFEAKHQDILTEESFLHFEFDREMFEKAIVKEFKALPTNQASIPKIVKTIKPENVLKEKKNDE
jgi:hypothetical protein